ALFQLAFIRHLEESTGSGFPLYRRKVHQSQERHLYLPKGFSPWEQDEDARILRIGFVKPEIISWSPRIIVLHNFLSNEGIKSDVRTSSGMFLNHEEKKYQMIKAIEKRVSVYSQVPVENGELMQILRYEKGEFYKPHHDYFSDEFNIKRGQRIATMLMYLSDDLQGGETNFPLAGDMECSCGGKMVKGVCVKPKKGDAVLFWSMGLDGSVDPKSIHGGCEVLEGVKWSATKWMRERTA
ncbi:hypothetical protein KI387_009482, partial [Taxus chinensis]